VLGLFGDRMNLTAGGHAAGSSLPEQVEQFERSMIQEELRRHRGDVGTSAKALGVPKQTLYDKMRRLGISTEDFKLES
jgi:two-component system C4-dicarboxylate transport response regulator DctD